MGIARNFVQIITMRFKKDAFKIGFA